MPHACDVVPAGDLHSPCDPLHACETVEAYAVDPAYRANHEEHEDHLGELHFVSPQLCHGPLALRRQRREAPGPVDSKFCADGVGARKVFSHTVVSDDAVSSGIPTATNL